MRSIWPMSLAVLLVVPGCSALSPVGKNAALFPAYKVPDEAGQVEVSYTPTAEDAASATFKLKLPADVAATLENEDAEIDGIATECSDAEEGDVCAVFDTSALPPGFYPVEIFEGAEDPAVATALVVVKNALAAEDAEASGAEE
ncbi:MAG: hypothetical protein VKS61_01975 [Candidatus Sericytochromatia bacterium]|nr:hypothetical protein [Candidatus Sericytochromatia bacterium]